MLFNQVVNRWRARLIGPAALFGGGAAVGFWAGFSSDNGVQLALAAGAFGLILIGLLAWQLRSQARGQWQGIWNAYAEREIASAQRLRLSPQPFVHYREERFSRRNFDARAQSQAR